MIASRVVGEDRNRNRKEEKRILHIRIDKLRKEIAESRMNWTAETRRVNYVHGLSGNGSS